MATLETINTPFRKVRSVNSNSSSFPSKIPTTTEPKDDAGTAAGASIVELCIPQGGLVNNSFLVVPYGLGSSNDGFSMRVLGWKRIRSGTLFDLWVPVKLLEVACLLGASTGVAGSPVLNTELLCDTITIVSGSGNAGVSVDVLDPADDTIAHFVMALKGFSKLEFTFDQTTNTPTMNALISEL